MTQGQRDYLEYLKSEHWRRLRNQVLQRDGWRCARCPATQRLEAHHRFYRRRWEDSIPEDLVTLCCLCHDVAHGKVPSAPSPHIASRIGGKRWNSRGERVDRRGVPYNQRKLTKSQRKAQRKARKKKKQNRFRWRRVWN